MSATLFQQVYAGIGPWMALSLVLMGRNPWLSGIRITGSLLLAFFLLRIPVDGWHLFEWVRMLEPNPSFTLTALLALALFQRIRRRELFRREDWDAAWVIGALLAIVLYPMALGLTSIDAYGWGWGPRMPVGIALAAALLQLRDNRFGIILLLPFVGVLLHLQESTNFWDAMIDPFYGGASLLVSGWILLTRWRQR